MNGQINPAEAELQQQLVAKDGELAAANAAKVATEKQLAEHQLKLADAKQVEEKSLAKLQSVGRQNEDLTGKLTTAQDEINEQIDLANDANRRVQVAEQRAQQLSGVVNDRTADVRSLEQDLAKARSGWSWFNVIGAAAMIALVMLGGGLIATNIGLVGASSAPAQTQQAQQAPQQPTSDLPPLKTWDEVGNTAEQK
jgi:hypothetical protein